MTDELPPDPPPHGGSGAASPPTRPVLKYKRKRPKKKARRKKLVRFDVATSIRILKPELKALKVYAVKHDISVSHLLRKIITGWLQYQRLDIGKLHVPNVQMGDGE